MGERAHCALRGPRLQEIDREEDEERAYEHGEPDGGGARVVELFEPDDDQERRDLRDHRDVAGDEDDRAVFSDRARKGEAGAGHERRQDGGQQHAPEGLHPRGAERGRGFLDSRG